MSNLMCTVTFADGTSCTRERAGRKAWCHACAEWSRTNGGKDPNGRMAHRRKGALRLLLEQAAHATTDECLYLDGYNGRPRVYIDGRQKTTASRAVWIIRHGHPGEMHVLHTCNGGSGEGGCINIRHLRLGTPEENQNDRIDGGTSNRGMRHGNHKLTTKQVEEIRRRYVPFDKHGNSGGDLAREFGVNRSTISEVVNSKRRQWG